MLSKACPDHSLPLHTSALCPGPPNVTRTSPSSESKAGVLVDPADLALGMLFVAAMMGDAEAQVALAHR